ncbi:VIT domain-containing protein [Desulfoferula mesophila]|uniref:VIT domain-containing protein n=1 Tax=Desulfoferula mesophila TaxID=3058419 RepID=A0AAU9EAY7_9BACT|nr:hypothetical protein FAK_02110 [Desulfoferula mesophilus]
MRGRNFRDNDLALYVDEPILESVAVDATLRDLLGRVTVVQTYVNKGDTNIEAVFTFPLPLDAILLDFSMCEWRSKCGTVGGLKP